MRRQRFAWTYAVISVLLILYGSYFAFREHGNGSSLFVSAIVALSIGIAMMALYLVLYLVGKRQDANKAKEQKPQSKIEEEPAKEEEPLRTNSASIYRYPDAKPQYRESRSVYDSGESIYRGYVNKIGYGPVLEINGNQIRDMRDNSYYRIEGNYIYANGSGLLYEISGKRIRSVSGRELYEIYGGAVHKVFGGYFASISGNYITKHDLSERYEISSQPSSSLALIIVTLLFGEN